MVLELDYFLDWENDNFEEISQFRFSDNEIMMWPYIRTRLLGKQVLKSFDIKNSVYSLKKLQRIKLSDLISYIKGIYSFRGGVKDEKNILFFSSNIYNTSKKNEKYYNWLCDPYAELFNSESLIFERSSGYQIRRPRYFSEVLNLDLLLIKTRIASSCVKINDAEMRNIISFATFLKEKGSIFCINNNYYNEIIKTIVFYCKRIKYELKYYGNLFNKANPKVVFFDDASYGGVSHIINLAKKKNIIVCELQHGLINKSYSAYNYSQKVQENKDYQTYLPDYYLTFGEFWNNKNRSSSQVVTIGNPKMTNIIKFKESNNRLVFMIDENIKDALYNTIENIMGTFIKNKYVFVLRPHPTEHHLHGEYREFANKHHMEFDDNSSINDCLSKANVIVSEGSTVIFEAIAYGVVPFVRKTPFALSMGFNEEDVVYYETDQEFVSKLNDVDLFLQSKIDVDKYFDPNWEQNYRNFINGILK